MTRSRLIPVVFGLAVLVSGCSDDGGYYEGGGGFGDDGGEPAEVPDDVVKRDPGTSDACDVDQDVIAYLSPDDSNSMSSPVQVREKAEKALKDGDYQSAPSRYGPGSS